MNNPPRIIRVNSDAEKLEHLRRVYLMKDALADESVPEVESEIFRLSYRTGQVA
jgi:hypothetical protein